MTVPDQARPLVVSGPPAAAGPARVLPPLIVIALLAGLGWLTWDRLLVNRTPVVVGLLHMRTGPAAAAERSSLDGELLALEELAREGGLLGRPVRFVIAESDSDAATLAREAERLIREERVDVIFGCGTAAGRRSVVPVVEANDHLLLHTGSHEGFERSAHVFSTGITANQQVGTAVRWCREVLAARRFAIVSSPEIWSRCVAAVAADHVTALEGDVAVEAEITDAEAGVDDAVRLVGSTRPDAVLCVLPGAATIRLLERLTAAGIGPERTPVIAFGLGEEDLRGRPAAGIAGHYAAAGYFQSIDRPENLLFLGSFRNRFGAERNADAAAASAHAAVRLWAQAVRGIGTAEPRQVRHALVHQSLDAAEGIVAIDADTQHAWRPAFIGRLRDDGQFDVVAGSLGSLRPEPFPPTRSRRSWDEFVEAAGSGMATRRSGRDTAVATPPRPYAGRHP